MTRHNGPQRPGRRPPIALLGAAAAAAMLAPWTAGAPLRAQDRPGLAPALEMAAQEEPFRRVAEAFVAAAAAGDTRRAEAMISPAAAARTGPEGVQRYLAGAVLPFFAPFREIARSVTVTRTAEVTGFAYYMYMVSAGGELRPFVIYVVEGGAKVVANILVDRFVEGRHCVKMASGWQCPDLG